MSPPALSSQQRDLLASLKDQETRLKSLYYIQDKEGRRVKFEPTEAQLDYYRNQHYRNVILKARQLGFSTLIQILMLDTALFHPLTACGVIAHTLGDAQQLFASKIKYPYENLPTLIKTLNPIVQSNLTELVLANGSSIRVGTSLRSTTLQMLHVSEFGKMGARTPDKAAEVITGAFPTVSKDGQIFVESTAEGQAGDFFDMVRRARQRAHDPKPLTKLDFKFHFYSWTQDPQYALPAGSVTITDEARRYFRELEAKGIKTTPEQQAWYVQMESTQGEKMLREFPSEPDEAFRAPVRGAYYAKALYQAEKAGRITNVPYDPKYKVEVWWDIGMDDATAMIFVQRTPTALHVIDYYEHSDAGFPHYVNVLKDRQADLGYVYDRHIMPHDMRERELFSDGKDRITIAESLGVKPIKVAKKLSIAAGIEAVRTQLATAYFDATKCAKLLKCLREYRRKWDEKNGCWGDAPHHDWTSHGADSMRYGSITPAETSVFDGPLRHRSFGAV